MNHLPRTIRRPGAGILEVIICTGLVALMIVPLASVIRASGQSISDSNGEGSTESQMRSGLRYLSQVIRNGEIEQFRNSELTIRMPSGNTAVARVQGGNLELQQGTQSIALVENVHRIRFSEQRQRAGSLQRIGLEMQLTARNPATRRLVSISSAVALPPQT